MASSLVRGGRWLPRPGVDRIQDGELQNAGIGQVAIGCGTGAADLSTAGSSSAEAQTIAKAVAWRTIAERVGGEGIAEDEDAGGDLGRVGDQAHQADRLDRAAALKRGDRGVLGEDAADDDDRDPAAR